MKTKTLIFLLIISLFACHDKYRSKQITAFLDKKIGTLLELPDSVRVKSLKGNLIVEPDKARQYIDEQMLRITTFINGNCHSCVDDLNKWEKIIPKFPEDKVRFLFFINALNYASFEVMNDQNINFMGPVIYDYKNDYIKKNQIPENKLLQTFLIDDSGKIILIGNPISSISILNLFLETVMKYSEENI